MASTAHDFALFRFSTEDFPTEQRLAKLQETLDGCFGGRRTIRSLCNNPFRVDMTVRKIGRVDNSFGACVNHLTATLTSVARRIPEPASDHRVILYIQQAGRQIHWQRGREAIVNRGGGLLISNEDASTYVLPDPSRYVAIDVPHGAMRMMAPGFEDALARPLPPDAGVLRLLLYYLDVLEDDDALGTVELQRAFAAHIQDLCALAIGATRDAAEVARGRGLRAARLCAIKADIAQNLVEGDVSAPALATRQGVTPRYIHKLFESEGTTLSQFVLGQRLTKVHRMLADPRLGHQTIGAIAYAVGVGDLSTFNRAFRRHFGATPSDVRAAARARGRASEVMSRSGD